MRKITIIVIISIFGIAISAQDETAINVIKGRVINAESSIPVAYTNVGLEGTYYGTASDGDGNFEIKIPGELSDRQIFFSAVGYKNKMFPVNQLFNKEFSLIELESQSYNIDNIDINAQSKVFFRIIRTASENVSRNFFGGAMTMICSYENEKIRDTTRLLRKATVNIFDKTGYSDPSIENAFKSRRYTFSNVERNFESYSLTDGTTNMDEVIALDLARSVSSVLNPVTLSGFILSPEDDEILDGDDVWVIGFKQINPDFEGTGDYYANWFEGKIYINKNNYSVKKIEGWIKSTKNNRAGRGLAIGKNTKSFLSNIVSDFSILYNSQGLEYIALNKMYLENNIPVSEKTRLIVQTIKTSDVNPIVKSDYFEGK